MVKVEDIPLDEMKTILQRIGFGHLGCARDGRPYVLPMHYVYDSEALYFFTTEGMKTHFIDANNEVCFQVEEIDDPANWRSVMLTGRAERLTRPDEIERAMQLITKSNPTLTPAISRTQVDAWGRAEEIVLYRVKAEIIDGRRTVE